MAAEVPRIETPDCLVGNLVGLLADVFFQGNRHRPARPCRGSLMALHVWQLETKTAPMSASNLNGHSDAGLPGHESERELSGSDKRS